MASPFFRITQEVQNDHAIYASDMYNLKFLKKSLDPRVINYVEKLSSHKRECPICTSPRIYSFTRRFVRFWRSTLLRKVF